MYSLLQLDIEKEISKFQIKDPDSQHMSLVKLYIRNGLAQKLSHSIQYENINQKPIQNVIEQFNRYKSKSQCDINLQNLQENQQHSQEQSQSNGAIKLVNNYGNKKIYTDIASYIPEVKSNKHQVFSDQKRLDKIVKKIKRGKVLHEKKDLQKAHEIRRELYHYLYTKNYPNMKKKQLIMAHCQQREKEMEFGQLKKRKLNRELSTLKEGQKFANPGEEAPATAVVDGEVVSIKDDVPKSMYVQNINEGYYHFPAEINIIPITEVPQRHWYYSTRFVKEINKRTKFDLDRQNMFGNYIIKIKNILWLIRQHLLHPHDFYKISSNLDIHYQKLKVLYDTMNKSQGLDLKNKLLKLQKKKQSANELLRTSIFPELKDCFKSILKPYFASLNQEPSFPQNEIFISLEQFKYYLHMWDYHSFE